MSALTKIADAIQQIDPDTDNSFESHTFRKHKGKYHIYKGKFSPVGEGYGSYSEMLPAYLKLIKP